jgi:hypothetical protein
MIEVTMHDFDNPRLRRWNQWYGPARFGLFYHWGWNTGGGSSTEVAAWQKPFQHATIADFEAARAIRPMSRATWWTSPSTSARDTPSTRCCTRATASQ